MLTFYLLVRLLVGVIAGVLLTGYLSLQALLWAVGVLIEALMWLAESLQTKTQTHRRHR